MPLLPLQLMPAIPIDPKNIPEDLVCAICLGLPAKPVMTPCEHVFCSECILQSLAIRHQCPIDRCEVTPNQISDLRKGSLPWRIWAGTKVKCAHHIKGCAWTGQISEYEQHVPVCEANQQRDDEIASLKASVEALKRKNEDLEQKNTALLRRQQMRLPEAAADLFTGSYDYNQKTIADLTKLISHYSSGDVIKPGNIDSNKIFGCVEKFYHIFLRMEFNGNNFNYNFYHEMKKLTAACQASTDWFTRRQKDHIDAWVQEQGWEFEL